MTPQRIVAAERRDIPGWIPKLFYASAILNWVVTIGTIIDPVGSSALFGIAPPNYPFMARAWAGMAFLFGFMFFEIARDPIRKRAMIRYMRGSRNSSRRSR